MLIGKSLKYRIALALAMMSLMASQATRSNADLIIDVKDSFVLSGGLGSVDVLISSSGSDLLQSVSYRFLIEKISGDGVLEFQAGTESLTTPRQNKLEQQELNYVFAGDTIASLFSTTLPAAPNSLIAAGGDSTASGNDVTLTSSRLLVRLELQHITNTPLTAAGVFRISLSPDTLEFLNAASDNVNLAGDQFTNPNNFGTITVAAVPEPSSMLLMSLGLAMAAWHRRQRRSGG